MAGHEDESLIRAMASLRCSLPTLSRKARKSDAVEHSVAGGLVRDLRMLEMLTCLDLARSCDNAPGKDPAHLSRCRAKNVRGRVVRDGCLS